jgi:hypothetical protein
MNFIKNMNTKIYERRISEFKDKMEDMKYPRDEDIYLFISEIEMIFEELRDLKI